MSIKNDILWRVGLIYIFLVIFSLAITGRIIWLQFAEKEKWTVISESSPVRQVAVAAYRGDIYSSDGRILALSVPYYEIRMDFKSLSRDIFYSHADELARKLSQLFNDRSAGDYKRDLVRGYKAGSRYFLIRKDVTYDQMVRAREFPIFNQGRYKGGVRFIEDTKRIRPNGYLAARTIGSTTKSEIGNRVGIEGSYDKYLRGEDGLGLQQKLSGNLYVPVGDGPQIEPTDGKDVISTIDLNIQDVTEKALLRALMTHDAHHGAAIVLEVNTGEVKAIANLERNENGGYFESYNYAIGESVNPGSTFKLASMIVALEDGCFDIGDSVNTGDGTMTIYGRKIVDSGNKGLGKISVQEVFEKSSNVGVVKLIYENYKGKEKNFVDGLYKLGLNNMLNLDIYGEGKPEIKYPGQKGWSGISLPWMSIGYEISMTPMQMLTLYNAVANNGVMVKPRFVREIHYHGNVDKRFSTEIINPSICSKSTLKKVRSMLEGVVDSGTASNLRSTSFKIAGKTGTAQLPDSKTGFRVKSGINYQASFVGYFPADDPHYSCIVVVNSPSVLYYGNIVAGPVFREIANKVYATMLDIQDPINEKKYDIAEMPYSKSGYRSDLIEVLDHLDIPYNTTDKKSNWVMASQQKQSILVKPRPVIPNLVPNVIGMGMKDALYLLENCGLVVQVSGRGTVKAQSLPPGTKASKGYNIRLEMTLPDS